jgi:hypothetical protein
VPFAHQAIPIVLERAAAQGCPGQLTFHWKHASMVGPPSGYHGVWCVPASPYASEAAAVEAFRWTREGKVPFSGRPETFNTRCSSSRGNVIVLSATEHAETAEGSDCLVVSRAGLELRRQVAA